MLEPRSFSFNSLYGACPECNGLGSKYDFDPAKVMTDWSKPLLDGGLGPGSASQNLIRMLQLAAQAYGFDLSLPFEQLPRKTQNLILYGPEAKREEARVSRHLQLSAAGDGGKFVGDLSRLAARSYVGDDLSGLSRQAFAA